jgi:cephalosporin hydroxylase
MLADVEALKYRTRRFVQRVAHFVKPRVAYKPLSVDELLQTQSSRDLIERFNDLWYKSGTPGELNWRGDTVLKNPCDLWMIVELFQKLRPRVIVETGTHRGGSASFYADMLRLLEIEATVITVDINPKWSFEPRSKNIVSVIGYSTDPESVRRVEAEVASAQGSQPGPVMVLLDSDHSEQNVTKELELYSKFVTKGSYVVVEDTNVNGHPSSLDHGPGPWEAVDSFLGRHPEFLADKDCERFLLTFFPRGWLRRVG